MLIRYGIAACAVIRNCPDAGEPKPRATGIGGFAERFFERTIAE